MRPWSSAAYKPRMARVLLFLLMLGSVNASARVVIIGKSTATAPKKGVIVVLPSAPTPGTVVTLPGANPLPVTRVVTAPAAPAPVVIVPPITNSGANKTLSRTI